MVTISNIPVYEAVITDESTGMFKISLVDEPAVMSDFLAFDNVRKPVMYKVENDEQRLVRGVVMRADFPIYRRDERLGEYYVIYHAAEIRKMVEKYLVESRQNDVNLMHGANTDVNGVQMVQVFIKDTAAGVNPVGFEDIAEGSLFAEFHVTNDKVWESIKAGTYRGFSLEGVFDLVPEQDKASIEDIVDDLEGKFRKLFKHKNNMSKIERFMAALAKAWAAFASVTTDKGVLAWDGDEDIKAGDAVFIEDAEGNRTPAEDGEYKTEEGKVIIVADGKVSEIVDPDVEVEEAPEAMASIATDKATLVWEGEGEIAVGIEVFVEDAEGNRTPAEDGDYVAEDGRTIKVAEGKVAEIVEAEQPAEETPATEELKKEIESLKKEIATLRKEVAKFKAMPMAKSAHEEVKTTQTMSKTGVKGLDRLQQYLKA